MRGTIWFASLLAAFFAAVVSQIVLGFPSEQIFVPEAWVVWLTADPVKAASSLVVALVLGFGAVAALDQLFGKPLKQEHLEDAVKKIVAEINRTRAPDTPALNSAVAAAQAGAVRSILTSVDPLDSKARAAVRRTDVPGTIAALLDAAKADKTQAARRYREAGALLFGRNVAQAIDAYEQAAALDPDDFWVRIFLVELHQWVGHLPTARLHAEEALKKAGDERERVAAISHIGNVQLQQGDLPGALKSYRVSLDIARTLAAGHDGDAQSQRDLSVSLNKVGDVLLLQDDYAGALAAYRDGLDLARKLAAAHADNAQAQRDLSISFNKIGDVLRLQDDLAGALASYRDGLDITRKLAAADDSGAQARRDLFISLNRIGFTLFLQNDLAEALKSHRDSLDIIRKLAAADPSDAQAQRDISIGFEMVGKVLERQGDLPGALKSYRDSLEIRRTLAEANTGDPRAQVDLAVGLAKIADTEEAAGNLPVACENFRAARDIFVRIAAQSPEWQDVKRMAQQATADAARVCGAP
jgi:tetratricopeptide (TPR) repeat protein